MGIFKKIARDNFSFGRWLGFKQVKESKKIITESCKGLKPKAGIKALPNENFEAYIKRLNIDEENLKKRKETAHRLLLVFLSGSVIALIYTFYQFIAVTWQGGLVGLLITLILFSYTLQECYRYALLKHRKLRCSISQLIGLLLSLKKN